MSDRPNFDEVFHGTLRVGMQVLYVPMGVVPTPGDRYQLQPAVVIAGLPNGAADLCVFPNMDRRRVCNHISSPGLRDQAGRPSELSRREGAWVFNPIYDAVWNDEVRAEYKAKVAGEAPAEDGKRRDKRVTVSNA